MQKVAQVLAEYKINFSSYSDKSEIEVLPAQIIPKEVLKVIAESDMKGIHVENRSIIISF